MSPPATDEVPGEQPAAGGRAKARSRGVAVRLGWPGLHCHPIPSTVNICAEERSEIIVTHIIRTAFCGIFIRGSGFFFIMIFHIFILVIT